MPSMSIPQLPKVLLLVFRMTSKERTLWLCNFKSGEIRNKENLFKRINQYISDHVGPIAKLDKIQFVSGLPKTRSGKIMRRILRKLQKVISLTLEYFDITKS
jgi:acyl-coenzyme A synthetase/AMP-(fatty) acid ligase